MSDSSATERVLLPRFCIDGGLLLDRAGRDEDEAAGRIFSETIWGARGVDGSSPRTVPGDVRPFDSALLPLLCFVTLEIAEPFSPFSVCPGSVFEGSKSLSSSRSASEERAVSNCKVV